MKKTVLLALALVLAGGSAIAKSTVYNNPDNKVTFGIRVGGDIVLPSEIKTGKYAYDKYDNGGGAELGVVCNIPIVANFFIEPGVKAYFDTYEFDDDWSDNNDNNNDNWFNNPFNDELDMSINKFGVRIPLMLGYRFDVSEDFAVSLFTGPELEVGILGNIRTEGAFIDGMANVSFTEDLYSTEGSVYNRVNCLWDAGISILFQKMWLGVNAGFGITEMDTEPDKKFTENRVTISLGFNF